MLDKALHNNELDYHIQPQICADTRQIIGGELLVRWFKPDGEIVHPTMFVDFLEKGGFAETFFNWSVKRVIDITRQIHQEVGTWIPLSMNLSPAHIHNRKMIEQLVDTARRYKVPKHILEIEITERVLADDPKEVLTNLKRLDNEGFKIAIDDFGTGYSSLSYLRKFPIHRLKIDRIFVANLEESEEDRLIITSIVMLAHVLGLETIAEGVEDSFQATFLKESGCEYFQGYLTGKPVPIEDFSKLVKYNAEKYSWKDTPTSVLKQKEIPQRSRQIRWKKSFSTDIVSIDNEHRRLIDMLNDFIGGEPTKKNILNTLDEITLETIHHFQHEEHVMLNIQYPRYAKHKEKHRLLIADINKYRARIAENGNKSNFSEIVRYLKYWLLRHLVSEDTQLNRYLNKSVQERRT
jgi:hemerythrin-like metal-binding protein